jgi:hypothetical protein
MRRWILAGMVLFAAGCGDSTGTRGPTPATVLIGTMKDTLDFVGQTRQLTAQVIGNDGRALPTWPVAWSASGSAVEVSSAGLVTAKAPGVSIVTAAAGDAAASVEMAVRAPT